MEYLISKASDNDFEKLRQIYAQARAFMTEHGNATQWGKTYPADELLISDISMGKLYTIHDSEGIHGVFFFAIEEDLSYREIHNGAWRTDAPYGVIHRIAGDGSGGILKAAVDFAAGQSGYLRIDTHENNYVMRNALRKLGFQRSGVIYVEDGSPRIAYERLGDTTVPQQKELAAP